MIKKFKFVEPLLYTVGILLAIAAILFVSGCGVAPVPPEGEVYVIQTGTTLYWLKEAVRGQVGTYIMTNAKGDFLFLWNMQEQGLGFTMISSTPRSIEEWFSATGGKSNLANLKDAQAMMKYLRDYGWTAVAAKDIPLTIKASINASTEMLLTLGGNLVSFFVFPAGLDWNQMIPDGAEVGDA